MLRYILASDKCTFRFFHLTRCVRSTMLGGCVRYCTGSDSTILVGRLLLWFLLVFFVRPSTTYCKTVSIHISIYSYSSLFYFFAYLDAVLSSIFVLATNSLLAQLELEAVLIVLAAISSSKQLIHRVSDPDPYGVRIHWFDVSGSEYGSGFRFANDAKK